MPYEEHPKGKGALFINNDKQTEKQPDYRGNVVLTKEQIDRLNEMGKAGIEPALSIAGWKNISKSGMKYISLATEAYLKSEPQSSGGWDEPKKDDWRSDDTSVPF